MSSGSTSRRKRRLIAAILWVLGGVLAVPVASLLWTRHRIVTNDAAFARVTRGMTEAQVVEVMGKPHTIEREDFLPFWEDQQLPEAVGKRIRRQHGYRVQTFFLPITWTIGFDENGAVISKHRLD